MQIKLNDFFSLIIMIYYYNITDFNETITDDTPVVKFKKDNFIFDVNVFDEGC